jgi:hypothetical protein
MKTFHAWTTILLTLCALACGNPRLAAEEAKPGESGQAMSIEVVVAKDAGELERFAASELQRYAKPLFGATATIVETPTAAADGFFFLGTSGRLPAEAIESKALPTLSDQGFLLRKTQCMNKPAMLIVGGSPKALLWGVYELVERFGVTYLLSGDVLPEKQQAFSLPELDQVFEPTFKMRWFKTMGDFAMGMEGWGMADYRPFLDQLAKLKYNRIRIGGCPSAPFLNLQLKGVKRQSAVLWYGDHYPITADMPGRKLFGNATEFWNPDLLTPQAPCDELIAAGERHMHELTAYAHGRGIEVTSIWSLVDFSSDFRSVVPGAQTVNQLGQLTVSAGPTIRPDNPELTEIGGEAIRAFLNEYPDADTYGLGPGTEFPSWVDLYDWAWHEMDKQYGIESVLPLAEILRKANERTDHWDGGAARSVREVKGHITGLYFMLRLWNSPDVRPKSRRPDARLVVYEVAEELWPILPRILPKGAEQSIVMDYNSTRVLRRRKTLATAPVKEVPTTMVLTLHDDSVGTLPMLTTGALHELVGDMRKAGIQGFCTRQWLIGDHDPSVAYLGKAAWDPKTTPEVVQANQVRAVCGEAAVAPMLEMFREIEKVTTAMEDHGMGLTFPTPGMMLRQWAAEPMPKELVEDKAAYQRALDAVDKVPPPSRPEGKAYVAYWKGRLQFALRYFDAIEEVKMAATAEKAAQDAKTKGDTAAYRAKMAEAVQHADAAHAAVFDSLEAYAAVAKDRADAGAIATMAEHAWRALKTKADALRKEAG